MTYEQRAKEVLRSVETSYWLKEAIRESHKRDVVDVMKDVEILQALSKMRWEEVKAEGEM